jgi:hypothetical protein
MRNHISYAALGLALMAGTSLAHAQTVETVIAPPSGVLVTPAQAAPVQTVETVRTVQSTTTTPRRRVASRSLVRRRVASTVTTTRTTVRERIIPAPMAAAAPLTPAVEAITQPGYTEVVQGPVSASTYPGRLYDVVPGVAAPAFVAQPAFGASVVTPTPAYRYVYEPDRILVIDANTGIAVQAIPR